MGLSDTRTQSSKKVVPFDPLDVAIDPLHPMDLAGNSEKMSIVRVRTKDGREISLGRLISSYGRSIHGPRLIHYDTVYVIAPVNQMYDVIRNTLVKAGYKVQPDDKNYKPKR